MRRAFKLLAYGFVVALWGTLLFSPLASAFPGTSITFQSSDGLWGDNEIQFKGRGLRTIVVLFELYKIKCNVPVVTLQRVTRRPEGFSFDGLFNDYADPKWMVPLAENTQPKKVGSFEPECARRGIFASEAKLAADRADAYIRLLQNKSSTVK
jgi:hypothetical protein